MWHDTIDRNEVEACRVDTQKRVRATNSVKSRAEVETYDNNETAGMRKEIVVEYGCMSVSRPQFVFRIPG